MYDNRQYDIIEDIYTNVFCFFKEKEIVLFLCGAADNIENTLRYRVRSFLETDIKVNLKLKYKIFYPEEIVVDYFNKTKGSNLLTCEQFLANNSHFVVILCESPGALVELGAFTNNEYTVEKVIAAINIKYKRDRSFVMLGPVKLLKTKNTHNILYYGQDAIKFAENLSISIKKKYRKNVNKTSMLNLTTIIGMSYFIQLLLYFFKKITEKKIKEMIHYMSSLKNYAEMENFEALFISAKKLLFRDSLIERFSINQDVYYVLSHSGFENIKNMIMDCNKTVVCDKIRIRVMYNELYLTPHS